MFTGVEVIRGGGCDDHNNAEQDSNGSIRSTSTTLPPKEQLRLIMHKSKRYMLTTQGDTAIELV